MVPAASTVVWMPGAAPTAPSNPTLTSRVKQFSPRVLAVTPGTAVTFPNADPFFHNVFSLSPGNAFDLGLYRRGARRTYRPQASGLIRVYCNIHPHMAAYIMVLDGAAFALTDTMGRFRLLGLPPGRRVLHAWNERTGTQEFTVDVQRGQMLPFRAELDASRYQPVAHKNKYGKDYPPVTRDDDRY